MHKNKKAKARVSAQLKQKKVNTRFVAIGVEKEQEIVKLRSEGLNQEDIARAVGVNRATVSRALKRIAHRTVTALNITSVKLSSAEVQSQIHDEAPASLRKIAQLRDSAGKEEVQLSAAKDLMDRAGYKPVDKLMALHGVESMSSDELRQGFDSLLERVLTRVGDVVATSEVQNCEKTENQAPETEEPGNPEPSKNEA